MQNPIFTVLLEFLNSPRPKKAKEAQVWRYLRKAVAAIVEYSCALDTIRKTTKPLDREAIQAQADRLYESVLTYLHNALFRCKIYILPKRFAVKHSRLISKEVKLSDQQFLEGFRNFFTREMPFLRSMPHYGQHALDFLAMLSDSQTGMRRISQCGNCGLIFFSRYRRRQPFCTVRCRNAATNRIKAPHMAEYMRDKRRRDELRTWPIPEQADWKSEMTAWNALHYRMQYRDVRNFRKDWQQANHASE